MAEYYHSPESPYASFDGEKLHLRLRAPKGESARAEVILADRFERYLMEPFLEDGSFRYYACEVPKSRHTFHYLFHIGERRKEIWLNKYGPSEEPQHGGHFIFPVGLEEAFKTPEWVGDSVFYQIFPDRFFAGNPALKKKPLRQWGDQPDIHSFFGGDLDGIRKKLDYLEELGIGALYLTPIFQSQSNHKYNAASYEKIDPAFGSNADLKKLVGAAHRKGMRLILDGVFNHTGTDFFAFEDLIENGKKSRYRDWYHVSHFPIKHDPPNYDCWWNIPDLPQLNHLNPQVRRHVLKIAAKWIREAGIDGWRLDVPDEVPIGFWSEFRKTVKEANPDGYITGEIWYDAAPWLRGDKFDGVMNYRFRRAALDFIFEGKTAAETFLDQLARPLINYPDQASRASLTMLGSHDTPRILTLAGGDARKVRAAFLLQFGYVGAPMIYYGDEIGMEGDADPDCRRCMIWSEAGWNVELRRYIRGLIAVRREHVALRRGRFRPLHAEGKVAAFTREAGGERLVVCVNGGGEPAAFHSAEPVEGIDLLTGRKIAGEIPLSPYEGLLIRTC